MSRIQQQPGEYMLEEISCYLCGSDNTSHYTDAWDDLTGKQGTFHFVLFHQ